jgi:hypothetical protein
MFMFGVQHASHNSWVGWVLINSLNLVTKGVQLVKPIRWVACILCALT